MNLIIFYISPMRILVLICILMSFSFAERLTLGTPNEEKIHSPWLNLGLGIGILSPISSPEYEAQGKAFVNPSFLVGIQFASLTALTFEFDFTAPKGGVGGWVGIEQQFMNTDITPFAELQLGARYPGGADERNGAVFGPAGSLNTGVIFFRESSFRVRLKGGYEMILNDEYDMSWNAEVGFLFAIGQPGLQAIKVD